MSEPAPERDGTDGTDGTDEIPNPETGAGIGAGEGSTFEPEEDVPVEDR